MHKLHEYRLQTLLHPRDKHILCPLISRSHKGLRLTSVMNCVQAQHLFVPHAVKGKGVLPFAYSLSLSFCSKLYEVSVVHPSLALPAQCCTSTTREPRPIRLIPAVVMLFFRLPVLPLGASCFMTFLVGLRAYVVIFCISLLRCFTVMPCNTFSRRSKSSNSLKLMVRLGLYRLLRRAIT